MQLLFAVLLAAASATAAGRRFDVSTSAGRSGPCSAALPDGRSLVTGGGITGGGDTPVATTQYFALGGSTLAADPMIEARTSHICMGLPDNTVLVAGGIGAANSPTNSAEIFHPDTGQWTSTGAMLAGRTGASALLLTDGRVLVVGGQIDGQPSAALEIYDPARGRFEPVAGILSVPRKSAALAALADGRVLVAGGTGPGGTVLDTTDIFDPALDRVLPGPGMLSPRTNFPAARLPDGKILVAGGSNGSVELASAEIFDPEANEFSSSAPMRAARQGHLLVVIKNNGRALVAGGSSAGQPLDQAEYFIPWRAAFEPAAANAAGREGEVVTIGRLSGAGELMSTAAYASPTLSVLPDPNGSGETAVLAGAGWQPGEEVKLSMRQASVSADSHGRFTVVLERARHQSGAATYVFVRSATDEAGTRF